MSSNRKILIKSPEEASVHKDANIPASSLDAKEELLQVLFCGVCRTDGKIFAEGHRDLRLPCVPGHEFCGMDKSGKIYAVWPAKNCGVCNACRNGQENLCSDIEIIGFHRSGAMADFIQVPKSAMFPLPEGVTPLHSVFAEPLACAVNAIEQIIAKAPKKPETVAILGGGVCGILCGIAAKHYGMDATLIEISSGKIRQTAEFMKQNGLTQLNSVSDGTIFDAAINACTDAPAFFALLKRLTPGGTAAFFSGFSKNAQLISPDILNAIHYKQLTLVGAYGCTKSSFKTALKIISKTDIAPLIEDIVEFENGIEAIKKAYSGKYLRFIIDMNKSI